MNTELLDWYKKLIALRKSSPAFTGGSFDTIYSYDAGYGFIRMAGDDKYIVLVNFAEDNRCFRVDAARFGVCNLQNVFWEDERHEAPNGIFYVDMPGGWTKVFRCGR